MSVTSKYQSSSDNSDHHSLTNSIITTDENTSLTDYYNEDDDEQEDTPMTQESPLDSQTDVSAQTQVDNHQSNTIRPKPPPYFKPPPFTLGAGAPDQPNRGYPGISTTNKRVASPLSRSPVIKAVQPQHLPTASGISPLPQPHFRLENNKKAPSSEQFAPSPIPKLDNRNKVDQKLQRNDNLQDLLKFPSESSHAYSYAHLSPNSLALRLNVLKRSLEILKDRPELFKSITHQDHFEEEITPLQRSITNTIIDDTSILDSTVLDGSAATTTRSSIFSHPNHSADYIHDVSSPTTAASFLDKKKYKLQSNASSAALAALFKPTLQRSDSAPSVNKDARKFSAPPNLQQDTISVKKRNLSQQSQQQGSMDDYKDIIDLLEHDLDSLMENTQVATSLHDLSLSTHEDKDKIKYDILKKKLIYALAMPFVENSTKTSELLENSLKDDPSSMMSPMKPTFSTVALTELARIDQMNNNNKSSTQSPTTPTMTMSKQEQFNAKRPFNSMLTSKYSSPQSIFTVEADLPWSVKAANDLACLMFGISKTTIKALTLMDLIAPQFRDFVMSRITEYTFENSRKDSILFAGEIVAIVRPGDQNYSWTSLWAKKKGKLIICMFDQIPCDAFDVIISSPGGGEKDGGFFGNSYTIDSYHEIAGSLASVYGLDKVKTLAELSETMSTELIKYGSGEDDLEKSAARDSDFINHTRYFTVQVDQGSESIPCAITSTALSLDDDEEPQIKLKIHSMPYIAGIFVLNAIDFTILSCNNAIAKNLFGRSAKYLRGRGIDELIPNFTKILQVGLEKNIETFQVVNGLVLPEHFFRKYDSVIKYQEQSDENESEEDIFFKCPGIEGKHRDGRTLYVDVQARVSTENALILWVTYSRGKRDSSLTTELEALSSSASSMSLTSTDDHSMVSVPSRTQTQSNLLNSVDGIQVHARQAPAQPPPQPQPQPQQPQPSHLNHHLHPHHAAIAHSRTHTGGSTASANNIPSQRKLFEDAKEEDLLEFSPREVTRSSSTRRVKTSSFATPMTGLDSFIYKKAKDDQIKGADTGKSQDTESIESREITTPDDLDYNISSTAYTEEEILALENKSLAMIKAESTHWPKEVGLLRRAKKFSEFKIIKQMGEGAYAKVVLAQHKEDPVYKIIIKCIDKERILVDTWVRDRKLGTIPSEIQVMAFLNSEPHPNIVRIIDFFEDSKYYYLETPIFGNPPAIDLFDFIEVKKDLSEYECKFIFKQIVSAVYHLHKEGIVHRDIKDENIIVDEKGFIKLIDFGSAGYVKQGPFDVFVGTIDYASPEVLRGEKYEGKPQDIWALGILLYTMLYKENPFYNVDEILEGDLRIPYVVSESSLSLVKRILVRDVDKRPTITDIFEDDWLKI
ncbi:FUN31 [Candida metapsilosis]|uniref:non-specific serine/threonine protein kinase n=1 Tax=Candida metapsilosis TaxID=273372 RepID=A0A8H7ZKU6_9ASCO|nr:FUN31 [Candida metapsilosis]